MKEIWRKLNLNPQNKPLTESKSINSNPNSHTVRRAFIAFLLSTTIVACSFGQVGPTGFDGYHYGLPIHYNTINQGYTPVPTGVSTNLIYTPGQMAMFWHRYLGNQPMPSGIQWGHQMLIAVIGGVQPIGTKVQVIDIRHQTPGTTVVDWCLTHGGPASGLWTGFGSNYTPTSYGSPTVTGAAGPIHVLGLPPVGTVSPIDPNRDHGQHHGHFLEASYLQSVAPATGSPFTVELSDIPTGTIHFQNLPPVNYGPSMMYLGPNCGYGFPGYSVNDAWPYTVIGYGPGCFAPTPIETTITSPFGYLQYCRRYFDGWVNLPTSFNWYQYSLIAINPGRLSYPAEIRILGIRRIGPRHLELEYGILPGRMTNYHRQVQAGKSEKGYVPNPFAIVRIPRTNDLVTIRKVNLLPQHR